MPTAVLLPQPCAEDWNAMRPATGGRHCAACQKTVIDFTQKTDAEILAYLTLAAGQACGRFRKAQLGRPLAPALPRPPGRPPHRWSAWLALAVAAWGLRGAPAAASPPPTPSATHPRKKANPPARPAARLLHGTVRDAATHEPLAGVAVFLKGEKRAATTDAKGRFSLRPPAGWRGRHTLVLHLAGYQSATVRRPASAVAPLRLQLRAALGDVPDSGEMLGGVQMLVEELVVVPTPTPVSAPAPELPATPARSRWHWLTHLFQR